MGIFLDIRVGDLFGVPITVAVSFVVGPVILIDVFSIIELVQGVVFLVIVQNVMVVWVVLRGADP